MNRVEIDKLLRSAYDARIRGHLDEMLGHFSDGAHFSVVGSPAASPVPATAFGHAAIREVLRRLTDSIEFLAAEIRDIIVDPETGHAAVHSRVRIRARGSDQEAETELVDLIRIEGGRIVSFRQFADTALASHLLQR